MIGRCVSKKKVDSCERVNFWFFVAAGYAAFMSKLTGRPCEVSTCACGVADDCLRSRCDAIPGRGYPHCQKQAQCQCQEFSMFHNVDF